MKMTANLKVKRRILGVVPGKLSVSEASDLLTADPLRPRCPTQTGSTLQSGGLGGGKNTLEGVPRLGEGACRALPTCGVVQPRSVPLVLLGLLV